MKKIAIFSMIFVLIFLTASPSVNSDLKEEQEKLQQYKMELEKIKKDINNVNVTSAEVISLINKIGLEMQNVSQNITVIQNKINTLQKTIQDKEKEIEQNNQLIQSHKQAIITSIQLSYRISIISPVEIFFSNSDPEESDTQISYLSYIANNNKQLLIKLNNAVQNLKEEKAKLEQNKVNLVAFLQDKESEQKVLEQEEELKKQLLVSLKQRKLSDITKKTLLEEEIKKEQAIIEKLIREANQNKLILKGGLIWPVKGPISSPFGWRINPIWHSREFHPGIDIAVGTGTPVKAAASGIVSYAGWMTGYGNVVIISHGSDISTLYAHLRNFIVRKGQHVSQGQIIGYVDSTGWSTGPHLHFGVYLGDKPVNPMKYLP